MEPGAQTSSILLPTSEAARDAMEDALSDGVADTVLKQFYDLPKKGKPLLRGGGVKEWVPLSGIVAEGEICGVLSQVQNANAVFRKREFEMCSPGVILLVSLGGSERPS